MTLPSRFSIKGITTLVLMLLCHSATTAVTVDRTSSNYCDACSPPFNRGFSLTVTGSNNLLCVLLSYQGIQTWSVSVNGSRITQLVDTDANISDCEIWYLNNPAAGIYWIEYGVPAGSAATRGVTYAASFNGVDTANPLDTPVGGSGAATPITLNLVTNGDELVIDTVGANRSSAFITHQSPQTSLLNYSTINGTINQRGSVGMSYRSAVSGTTSMSWTVTGTTNGWAASSVGINPFGATAGQYMTPGTMRC
jgi:hypothetical protein